MSILKKLESGDERYRCNMAITDPELNEQAILLFATQIDQRAVLHEFGRCTAVKTSEGIELRSQYKLVEGYLDKTITEVYPRDLAESIIHLPEDAGIEHQIVEYATKDKNNLGMSADDYLEGALNTFLNSLRTIQRDENGDRVQTAVERIYNCLKCIIFAEIAKKFTPGTLDGRFMDLSKRFQSDCIDLAGIDAHNLWSKRTTIKQWVGQCTITLTTITASTRRR